MRPARSESGSDNKGRNRGRRWGEASRWALALLVAAPLIGCATSPPSREAARPAAPVPAPLTEVSSPRLHLVSDAAPAQAAALAAVLEDGLAALAASKLLPEIPGRPPRREPLDVVVFEREEDLASLAPVGATGWFVPAGSGSGAPVDLPGLDPLPPLIVVHGGSTREVRRRVLHELVHEAIARNRAPGVPRLPSWLEEGYAEFASTVRWDGEPGARSLIVGELPMQRLFVTQALETRGLGSRMVDHRIPYYDTPPLGELMAASVAAFQEEGRGAVLYASSWVLMHLLASQPEGLAGLRALLCDVASGTDAAGALRGRFRAGADTLEEAYREHLGREELPSFRLATAAPRLATLDAPARRLLDHEAHLVWARVRPWSSRENIVRAGADIEAALRLAPEAAEAHAWMARYHHLWRRFAAAQRELRLAQGARGDDAPTRQAAAPTAPLPPPVEAPPENGGAVGEGDGASYL